MKVLIIGNGGREHALGWSISQDKDVEEVIYAKGNAGTGVDAKSRNISIDGSKRENFNALIDIVEKQDIGMIVDGPEQPLVDGIVDLFHEGGYKRILGPTSAASVIEADKFYSYHAMSEAGIPQAESMLCFSTEDAEKAIKKMATDKGVVIKARGLTAGKGVYVCDSREEALARIGEHAKLYGPEVLIAERLFGQEFSVFAISDGERVAPLGISIQDHKALLNGDKGPNTGGMGAYGPAPIAGAKTVGEVADRMMTPLVKFMKKDGKEFRGFLYAAVIMTEKGPKNLEYNARLGDPETQPLVMMLDGGIYKPIKYAQGGRLKEIDVKFRPGAACCVVMASNGYPGKYDKGLPIGGLEEVSEMENVKVFHAGTDIKDGRTVTSGGRVLGVTAYSAEGIADAQNRAYDAVGIIDEATTQLNNRIVFIFRTDIADKALHMMRR